MSNSFMTPWTVAHQAPLPVGLPRQEYCCVLPFSTPGDLLDSVIEPLSLALAGSEPPGIPWRKISGF